MTSRSQLQVREVSVGKTKGREKTNTAQSKLPLTMQHTSERAKSGLDLRQDSSRSPLLYNRQKTATKASGPSVQVGKQVLANLREIQQNYKFYADSYNQHLEERQELIEVMQRNEQLEADLAR